jgi:hypothetical protein
VFLISSSYALQKGDPKGGSTMTGALRLGPGLQVLNTRFRDDHKSSADVVALGHRQTIYRATRKVGVKFRGAASDPERHTIFLSRVLRDHSPS